MSASPQSCIVASLAEKSSNPFSSISLSPNREFAVVAAKDALLLIRVDPSGIKSLRKFKISQYLQASVTEEHRSQVKSMYGDVRDTFNLGVKQPPRAGNTMAHANAIITGVAWSPPQLPKGEGGGDKMLEGPLDTDKAEEDGSLVAAAGSNGAIAIWNAKQAFFSGGTSQGSSALANQQPEAILGQEHSRAVNSLAWHPTRPGILLSASQDATVKLWQRKKNIHRKGQDNESKMRFGFFNKVQGQNNRDYSWYCTSTFEPKSEAVREIQWSKFQEDIFALVTVSGSLVIYSVHVPYKSIVKIAAHAGDATSLDWHPTRPFVIATGGAGDRCVKVWDVDSSVNMKADESAMAANSNTWNTTKSEMSTNSISSNDTDKSLPSPNTLSLHNAVTLNSANGRSIGGSVGQGKSKSSSDMLRHVITIASSVTKVRWRPPASDAASARSGEEKVDRHDSMLAVATARLTSAGGSGAISLWSTHRPFMPLSVVEGHEEGAVAGFVWIQTPQMRNNFSQDESDPYGSDLLMQSESRGQKRSGTSPKEESILVRSANRGDVDSILFDNKREQTKSEISTTAIWQHVLSVGRDGKCILQSFVRGDHPILRVPSSCFAMANLSPFQRGFGSLQVFSVHQQVPNNRGSDFMLTALRRDEVTARAPGVFKEIPIEPEESSETIVRGAGRERLPKNTPELVFNVVDQGPLDENGLPSITDDDAVCVAPEVVHLSRFASSYKLYPDTHCPTRVELCLHNGSVAESLRCAPLARMWLSVAGMLRGSGLDELPPKGSSHSPMNVMQFAIVPTIKALLLERAEAGDVQTCVALCEVLQVIEPDEQTRIPGLELNLVREWYLGYIELLHQMCLWVSATHLIKNCKDSFIGALNKQSTEIHESCPRCGKALEQSAETRLQGTARQACNNCRRQVGLCFLCHEPVKGVFVWCPGCGHGGHLEHALQWFGGLNGSSVREVCPTGCGHKCNLVQRVSAFPRTDSLKCLPIGESSTSNE